LCNLNLVLASRSPQRRAILEQLRLPFRVVPSDHVEETVPGDPVATAERNAFGKAADLFEHGLIGPGEVVLGVDTVVVIDDHILGKAADVRQARGYLRTLRGRTHDVISGLTVLHAGTALVGHAVTAVTFRAFSDDAVERYLASDEWRDRAGAYAIQGVGSALVQAVRGDYFNVVGLPVALLVDRLAELGEDAFGWLC
jgi:septum formation protein